MNTAVEDELPLFSDEDVSLHFSRITPEIFPTTPDDERYLESLVRQLPAAIRSFTGIALKGIILGCTSASFSVSPNEIQYSPLLITAFECILFELKQRGIRELCLVGPYSDSILNTEKEALEREGILVRVVRKISTAKEFRNLSKVELQELIDDLPDRIPILLSCTALYTFDLVQEHERKIVTSISAMGVYISAHK